MQWIKRGLLLLWFCVAPTSGRCQPPAEFRVQEADIANIHRMMRAGNVTARQLVDAYLKRIAAYDHRGPALNAIIRINRRARQRADELDADPQCRKP